MNDHSEMLRLIAVDTMRKSRSEEDKVKARALTSAANYLDFLEESLYEEVLDLREERDYHFNRAAALEKEIEYLKS